ncbi:MAG: carboxypeptidase regulatory-like domain-containing protein [Acidobacteria bacterium]|nr:MAG: carboxypeptidase regulatory-like domain-containing protein [Acidobacteriota bacterium]
MRFLASSGQRSLRSLVLLIFMAVFLAPPARAQVTAEILGTIMDPSGGAVANAQVEAEEQRTGFVRSTVTDEEGRYDLAALPAGQYQVTVRKEGFRTAVHTSIVVTAAEQAVMNFSLRLGEFRQQLTIRGQAPLVNLSASSNAGMVGTREVKDLPLNGRSYDELLTLNPGIVDYTSEKRGGVGGSNSAVGNMFAVLGRRPQENLFLLNGVEYTGAAEINMQPAATSGQLLGVDAIREFNVVTGAYGAEYGKRPGAQVSILTDSGTNQWHGTIFEFLRNSALDARNFFDRGSKPSFQRNQFGGALGGPIQRNKTFIFGNYEGYRQHLRLSNVALVPDNEARQGYLPGPSGVPIYVGVAPGAAPLLSLWPQANGPELGSGIAEAFSHPLQTIHEDFGTTRLDRQFSARDSMSAIYTIDDSDDVTPSANPLSVEVESLREQVASLEETHLISPTALNVARIGFSRAAYFFTGTSAVDLPGFIQGRPIGSVVIGGGASPNAATQISQAGTNIGSNLFINRNLFTYEDRLAVHEGRHQITGGVWFQQVQSNDRLALSQYGQASFSSLQDFLEGNVSTFVAVPSPTAMAWRSLEGALYVQDNMRLRRNLTFSLGFRDEFTNGWNEARDRAANFVFDSQGVIETSPRVAHSAFTLNRAKFLPEPRVGLAWDPFGNEKTVVRAGFGLYAHLQDALSYRLDQNAPFNTTLHMKNVPLASFPLVPGSSLPATALVEPAGVQPSLQTPMVEVYSLGIEHALASNTVIRASYVGSHSYHEIVSIDANIPVPVICPALPCPATLPAGTIYTPRGARRANPELANTWTWFSEGVSFYNGLNAEIRQRFSRGLEFRGAYTWSKSLDNGDTLNPSAATNAPGLAMNPQNLSMDYGLSTFDVRHIAVLSGSYQLPFGEGHRFLVAETGWRGNLASGWMLDAVVTARSGFPFTPQLSFNPSNNGDTRNSVRPSFNPAFTGPVVLGGPGRYFDPNAFIVPPNGTYGNVGRDTFPGPGMESFDTSVTKDMAVTEGLKIELRAEFFNVINRPNFSTPNLIVFTLPTGAPATTAGIITGTSTSARQIQFGLKLLW